MKDRTVGQIVDEVMEAIPEEHKHNFAQAMDDLTYAAPEVINSWFNDKFLRTFNFIIPHPPVEDWHFAAVAALARKTIKEVREEFKTKEEC